MRFIDRNTLIKIIRNNLSEKNHNFQLDGIEKKKSVHKKDARHAWDKLNMQNQA